MLIIGHVISKKHDTLATIFILLCETPAHSHLELWRKAGVSMQHMESFSWSRTTETYFFPTPLIISSDNIVQLLMLRDSETRNASGERLLYDTILRLHTHICGYSSWLKKGSLINNVFAAGAVMTVWACDESLTEKQTIKMH